MLGAVLLVVFGIAAHAADLTVRPVPQDVRDSFKLAGFYQKYVDAGGLPVVGSSRVSDAAVAECAWIVSHILENRPDVLAALAGNHVRFAVMAYDEYTTDIPEHSFLEPKVYWDRRARGLGATPEAPAVSGGEENLLAIPGDPYPTEIIPIHEFAHAIHEMGMSKVDPTFDGRLKETYEKAMDAGLWKETYAAVNYAEYWAEASQAWFDNNAANDSLHNDISTRAKLKKYDPDVAALCAEVYGDLPWRYQKPSDRLPEERAHLAGYDPATAPRFQWRDAPVPDRPRITFYCAEGKLTFEFDDTSPRESLVKLMQQVQDGFYSGGRARFSDDRLVLNACTTKPDGQALAEGEGVWEIALEAKPGAAELEGLKASIVEGQSVQSELIRESAKGDIKVQRIVRVN